MIKSGKGLILLPAMAIIVALAAPGCATKKYVSKQINPVNQKLNQYEKDTNGKIAWITNKEQTDVSALNERITTTDQKVAEVSTAVQEAQGTASRAMEAPFLRSRLRVASSFSTKATIMSPFSAVSQRLQMMMSPSLMPASIIESPLTSSAKCSPPRTISGGTQMSCV